MASIKVKFRPSAANGHEGIIFYQIIHDRKRRQLPTNYRLFSPEWDERHSMILNPARSERRPFVMSVREQVRCDIDRLARIIRKLEDVGLTYTVDDVITQYRRYVCEYSLFNFMATTIVKLRQTGKIRTSETYTATLNSFRKFRSNEDIMLDCLNADIMEAYEAWLQQRGVAPNTISFYNRILRAVYNRAVENNIIDNRFPFRHVYTGIDKTVKRALPLPSIRKIKSLDLSHTPTLDFARDMFIMSFMLRGMSLVDMAFLKKTDLSNGYITYRRRKTGQQLTIAWTDEMQTLLDKYPANHSDYLLPIIRKKNADERCAYRSAAYTINHGLKTIAKKAGVHIPLTLYVARHSWASVAKSKGIPVSVISEGMGHNSESTTQIYLASLDTSIVDRANSIILKSL